MRIMCSICLTGSTPTGYFFSRSLRERHMKMTTSRRTTPTTTKQGAPTHAPASPVTRGRAAGTKNRNYPPMTLDNALKMSRVIQDDASGMRVSRLTLSELLGVSPSSSNFRDLVAASRFFGLTEGGINAAEFSLTPIGQDATSAS